MITYLTYRIPVLTTTLVVATLVVTVTLYNMANIEEEHKGVESAEPVAPAESAEPAKPAEPKTINLETATDEEFSEVINDRIKTYKKFKEELEEKNTAVQDASKHAALAVRQCVGGDPASAAKAFHAQYKLTEVQSELLQNVVAQLRALEDVLYIQQSHAAKQTKQTKQAK